MIGLVLILALPVGSSAQTAGLNVNSLSTLPPQTELVSINRFGTDSAGSRSNSPPSISSDGRFVAFLSNGRDLDTTGAVCPLNPFDLVHNCLFVRDLAAGNTTVLANSDFQDAVFSTDERLMAYTVGLNASPGLNTGDVFVRDLATGATTLVSVNQLGTGHPNFIVSLLPKISADGRFVAFASQASDLVMTDTNGQLDVFVRDLQTGTTTLVSVNQAGTNSGNGSGSALSSLSADGRFVAFTSSATNLVITGINPARGNVFVRDLLTGSTVLASVNRFGTNGGNGSSGSPALSADGRFVAFTSLADDLVEGGTNGQQNVFVRDLFTGTTVLTSINILGANGGNGASSFPTLSTDGWFVAFTSDASDLVATDTNGQSDVFVRDLQRGLTTLVSVNQFGTNSGGSGSNRDVLPLPNAMLSANGRFVAFTSDASDLVATDINGQQDVFVRDLAMGTTTLISVNRVGTDSGNDASRFPAMSADGRFMAFSSAASDLVTTDTDGRSDVFVRPIVTDSNPPLITPHVAGTLGANGWYRSKVTVSWSVTDPDSGIASSSGCADTTLTADTPKTTVTCSATNGAGLSTSETVIVKIDKTPPVITGLPAPGCTLWPPNHKLIQVGTITASDAMSGLASFDVRGSSNESSVPGEVDIVITGNGLLSRTVRLRADRSGNGKGRIYTVTTIAVDQAGNTTTATAACTVPHDQGK